MIKVLITDAIVSKGYQDAPAIRFSEKDGIKSAAQFKVGHRVYDPRAEGKHKYINMAVKAFGAVCERIDKMGLKEGSFITLIGRLDEEKWTEEEQERSRMVVIAEDIEYVSNGGGKTNGNGSGSAPSAQNGQGNNMPPQDPRQSQQNTQYAPLRRNSLSRIFRANRWGCRPVLPDTRRLVTTKIPSSLNPTFRNK